MSGSRRSIITVSYNSGPLIWRCLHALWPQLRFADEVFLVDNASSDGSLEGIEDAFPGLQVIRNAENRGYAAANNQAIGLAQGDYVLLLNPDVLLEPNALDTATAYLEPRPDIGILGARILLPDGRLDPPARRTFKTPATYFYKLTGLSWLFPSSRRFGRYYLSYLNDDDLTEVDAVVGAFLFIRRAAIARVGPLDERFFMYCEDEDWCWRVKQDGWRVVYHPQVIAHHFKGSSTRLRPFTMIYHWHRSILLYHRKNIAPRYPAPVNAFLYGSMGLSCLLTMGVNGVRRLASGSVVAPTAVPSTSAKGSSAPEEATVVNTPRHGVTALR
jgi:GT2 family glycosyltransferase